MYGSSSSSPATPLPPPETYVLPWPYGLPGGAGALPGGHTLQLPAALLGAGSPFGGFPPAGPPPPGVPAPQLGGYGALPLPAQCPGVKPELPGGLWGSPAPGAAPGVLSGGLPGLTGAFGTGMDGAQDAWSQARARCCSACGGCVRWLCAACRALVCDAGMITVLLWNCFLWSMLWFSGACAENASYKAIQGQRLPWCLCRQCVLAGPCGACARARCAKSPMCRAGRLVRKNVAARRADVSHSAAGRGPRSARRRLRRRLCGLAADHAGGAAAVPRQRLGCAPRRRAQVAQECTAVLRVLQVRAGCELLGLEPGCFPCRIMRARTSEAVAVDRVCTALSGHFRGTMLLKPALSRAHAGLLHMRISASARAAHGTARVGPGACSWKHQSRLQAHM